MTSVVTQTNTKKQKVYNLDCIQELKKMKKETVDIIGIGFYTLGSKRNRLPQRTH